MNLTGKISDKDGTIPSANIYVSDKSGKILIPTKGASSDISGKYLLMGLDPNDYVTVSYIGYSTITKRVGNLGSGSTVNYDFNLKPESIQGEEFKVIAYRDKPKPTDEMEIQKKLKYNTVAHAGIGLLALGIGLIVFKNIK